MRKLMFVVVMVMVGCTSHSDAPVSAASPAAAAAPAPAPPAPAPSGLSLGDRLAQEAASRPGGGLRVERVLAALSAEGETQVLASPVLARFCLMGRTRDGLGVAACEYDSEADAERGREHSRRSFDRLVPNRTLSVHRGTLLTVTFPGTASASAADRLVSAFEAM
jgi:hypothetical protein